MKSFKLHLVEQESKGTLHSFDVDETLMNTHAKIHVKDHKGKTVQKLSNQEYNDHKLKPGHDYDFREFRSSDKFAKTSKPIPKMIDKLKTIHKNIQGKSNHKIIINTARADMDDKDKYLDTFRKHGVPVDDTHVHRAGNLPGEDSVASKKAEVLRQHIKKHGYSKVHVYDDSKTNLNHAKALEKEFPDTKVHAWHVQHDGSVKKYNGKEE